MASTLPVKNEEHIILYRPQYVSTVTQKQVLCTEWVLLRSKCLGITILELETYLLDMNFTDTGNFGSLV